MLLETQKVYDAEIAEERARLALIEPIANEILEKRKTRGPESPSRVSVGVAV
jgi:hypothetical protein